jgi:hypothetical protein
MVGSLRFVTCCHKPEVEVPTEDESEEELELTKKDEEYPEVLELIP